MRAGGFIMDGYTSPRLNDRRFSGKIGCYSTVCANTWLLLMDGWDDRPRNATKEKFLWGLHLLKSYDTESNLSDSVGEGCNKKTFRKWSRFMLEGLEPNHVKVVYDN